MVVFVQDRDGNDNSFDGQAIKSFAGGRGSRLCITMNRSQSKRLGWIVRSACDTTGDGDENDGLPHYEKLFQ